MGATPQSLCEREICMIRLLETTRSGADHSTAIREESPIKPAQIQRPPKEKLTWIDICGQNTESIQRLSDAFSFHPLTLEDCLHFDERPKLQEFQSNNPYAFIVTHGFSLAELQDQTPEKGLLFPPVQAEFDNNTTTYAIRLNELHVYLGENYLITIHLHPIEGLDRIWKRISQDAASWQRGTDFIYYLLVNETVDGNLTTLEYLSEQIDALEQHVLDTPSRDTISTVYSVRKLLTSIRRTLSPQRDLMALLARHGGTSLIGAETAVYFRDVYDHLVRMNETLETSRDLLGNCVETYLSAVGQRTNDIMKQLTLLSSFILPMNFIVGFFGMNFDMLPIHSRWTLVTTLVVMFAAIPIGMLLWFRRKKWI